MEAAGAGRRGLRSNPGVIHDNSVLRVQSVPSVVTRGALAPLLLKHTRYNNVIDHVCFATDSPEV